MILLASKDTNKKILHNKTGTFRISQLNHNVLRIMVQRRGGRLCNSVMHKNNYGRRNNSLS